MISVRLFVVACLIVACIGCGKKEGEGPAPASASAAARAAGVANPLENPQMQGAMPQLPEGHPAPEKLAGESGEMDFSGIAPPDGGKTVGEIIASKASLAGQVVKLRGKVVRANLGIMGRNWFHVRDGTGEAGSDDLTVTSSAVAKVGDKVLVEGKLLVDRDFGYGYKYAAIIEDAAVVVE